MSGKPKLTTRDERLDEVCAELLLAVKVSEDEIAASATSSDQYEGLRLRIANIGARGPQTSRYERRLGFIASLVGRPRVLALATTGAILLLLAASLFVLRPLPSSTEQVAQQPAETLAPPGPTETPVASQTRDAGSIRPASNRLQRTGRRKHTESRSAEVATDFLPLTFVDDSRAQESGHVVRVKVLRSALIAFGVPMNMERAGELITADVVVGDDGLARAIRFVQ